MKKLMMFVTITGLGLSVFAVSPKKAAKKAADSYTVDAAGSTFKWHAKKVTGEHSGVASFKGGSVSLKGNVLIGGEIMVDMTTIDATDLQGEWHDKLVGHLKSDDFFSTEKNTTATIKIKSASAIKGAKAGENNYNVVADLTIKGITKEVKFGAFVVEKDAQVITNAEFDIDRTLYDIKYGSASFFEGIGDKAIANTFNVKVRVVAKK
jgi:polyisoprenoid-binding protein YceI